LLQAKKTTTKAVLFVTGDGLRIVDEQTRGLIADQVWNECSQASFLNVG
jgi:hypothetical protein